MLQDADSSHVDGARPDVARYERLLGEPIVVADPRITGAQVARVLGITSSQARQLAAHGELPSHGDRGKARQFRLSDVQRLEATISVDDAVKIWMCSRDEAVRIIAEATLAATSDPQRPIRRVDAVLEQGRRWKRAGSGHPARVPVERPRWSRKQRRANGWISTTEGAEILGVGPSYARRLAVEGGLPAEQDAFGRWWFETDRIQLIADVRTFRREQGWSFQPWEYGRRVTRENGG